MPTIETARLILRPFVADDLLQYHTQIYSDADVTRYLPGGVPRPIERTRAVLEFSVEHGQKHGFTLWAVIDKASSQLIGQCGLLYMQNAVDVEIAYAFGKAWWGQGYAAEAGRACLHYGFETAGLPQIVAVAYPDNLASQRVMQKNQHDAPVHHRPVLQCRAGAVYHPAPRVPAGQVTLSRQGLTY